MGWIIAGVVTLILLVVATKGKIFKWILDIVDDIFD